MTQYAKHTFILQSGFVTPDPTYLVRDAEPTRTIRDALLMTQTGPADTNHFYDEGIERLFQTYRAKPSLIKEFKFRESIIQETYRVFSSFKSFGGWILLQLSQPSVGYLHRQFLAETIAYLPSWRYELDHQAPNVRKTLPALYHPILLATEISRRAEARDDYTQKLTEYAKNNDVDFYELLRFWTLTEELVTDLLVSLHVIFGRRISYAGVNG